MVKHKKTWKNTPARRESISNARKRLSIYVKLGKEEYKERRKR